MVMSPAARGGRSLSMHVVICSLVKNGMKYLPAYRKLLEALYLPDHQSWSLCILEGDSDDGTWDYLVQWASECDRIVIGREDVGEPDAHEGIDGRAERWARAGNACLDLIPRGLNYTHVMWLESDLCFPLDLLTRLLSYDVDIIAPMIWIGGHFYDTWGFRDLRGRKWSNYPPYHPDYRSDSLLEMGSVGSCVLARRDILDAGIRFRGPYETGLIVGICYDARKKGFRVFADTSTSILHPVSLWEDQMWTVTGIELTDADAVTTLLPRERWGSLGVALHITSLSQETVIGVQQKLLKSVFAAWKTNSVDVSVEMAPPPFRKYSMKVTAGKPRGLARIPFLAGAMFALFKRIPLKTYSRDGAVYLDRGGIARFLGLTCRVIIGSTR